MNLKQKKKGEKTMTLSEKDIETESVISFRNKTIITPLQEPVVKASRIADELEPIISLAKINHNFEENNIECSECANIRELIKLQQTLRGNGK